MDSKIIHQPHLLRKWCMMLLALWIAAGCACAARNTAEKQDHPSFIFAPSTENTHLLNELIFLFSPPSLAHALAFNRHAMLATAMETMIDEVVTRLKPTAEEELLRTLQVLLTECFKQALQAMDRPLSPIDTPVSPSVATHFRRLLQSFFSTPSIASYRPLFEEDFGNVETVGLDACLGRLQRWHREFSEVVARMPRHYRLEDLSRFLVNFSSAYAEIELPGEHLDRKSPQVRMRSERERERGRERERERKEGDYAHAMRGICHCTVA